MPNQSLVDLTERTATADTDLIHVNSGGSDYKQTKQKFLRGNFAHQFANNSTLTSQLDTLASEVVFGTIHGDISSNGHQTETGMPVNSNGTVFARIFSTGQMSVSFFPNATSDEYVIFKQGTWGTWEKQPTRSEITALNNSLTNWNYYQIGSNSYGALDCRYNPSLKLCFMYWRGNSTVPGSAQYSFNLPSTPVLAPNDNVVVKLRNGDSMEVRTDNTVKVTLTGTSWSGGSLMYPTR